MLKLDELTDGEKMTQKMAEDPTGTNYFLIPFVGDHFLKLLFEIEFETFF